jgi:hypothetical protein
LKAKLKAIRIKFAPLGLPQSQKYSQNQPLAKTLTQSLGQFLHYFRDGFEPNEANSMRIAPIMAPSWTRC